MINIIISKSFVDDFCNLHCVLVSYRQLIHADGLLNKCLNDLCNC